MMIWWSRILWQWWQFVWWQEWRWWRRIWWWWSWVKLAKTMRIKMIVTKMTICVMLFNWQSDDNCHDAGQWCVQWWRLQFSYLHSNNYPMQLLGANRWWWWDDHYHHDDDGDDDNLFTCTATAIPRTPAVCSTDLDIWIATMMMMTKG